MFLSLLRRKDIDENSTQKLHSAVAISSVLSLIYQAVCVSSYYGSYFCCVLYFGRGEIFLLHCMARLESPAKTRRSGTAQGQLSPGMSWGIQCNSK